MKQCPRPGCGHRQPCPVHSIDRSHDISGTGTERGYTYRWRLAAKAFIVHNPLCALCQAAGRLTPAQCVDHITPHRGDMDLFWGQQNWQALCLRCHSRKTATEDGGFGWGKVQAKP